MKSLHWIIFSLASWIAIAPFIGDDVFTFIVNDNLGQEALLELLRWDGLIIGLAITIFSLIVVTLEQAKLKHPGLIAMHWLQIVLGVWIGVAPFALSFTFEVFTMSHVFSCVMIAVFALLQISFEPKEIK